MSEAWDKQTFGEGFREGFDRALETVLADPLFSPLVPLLTLEAKEKIARFIVRLVDANRQVNLTAITGPVESATKHVADSLTALLVGTWREGAIVCDLGTGGGLPGVVLSIVRPDLHVRLVDSAAKKLAFLAGAVEELGLNCETVHSRAEEAGRQGIFREAHDVVVARAVARMPVLAEYCLPLVKVGGWFIAMKGPDGQEELKEARRALQILGGEVADVQEVNLPLGAGRRTLIAVRKVSPTPSTYPRRPGLPAKKPLI